MFGGFMNFIELKNLFKPILESNLHISFAVGNMKPQAYISYYYFNQDSLRNIYDHLKENKELVIGKDQLDNYLSFVVNVPDSFYLKDSKEPKFYAHYNGCFMEVSFQNKGTIICFKPTEYKPDAKIFDYNANRHDVFIQNELASIQKRLISVFEDYEENCKYFKNRYTVVEKEYVPEDKIYDKYYSIKKEDVKSLEEWKEKHAKKYHKGQACGGGTSPVSFFEIRQGFTSIGSYKDCVCTKCYEEYQKETDRKKRDKLYKQAVYEIEPLG